MIIMVVCVQCSKFDCMRYVYAFEPVSPKKIHWCREPRTAHTSFWHGKIHFRYDKCVRELNTWLQANKYSDTMYFIFAIDDFYTSIRYGTSLISCSRFGWTTKTSPIILIYDDRFRSGFGWKRKKNLNGKSCANCTCTDSIIAKYEAIRCVWQKKCGLVTPASMVLVKTNFPSRSFLFRFLAWMSFAFPVRNSEWLEKKTREKYRKIKQAAVTNSMKTIP